MLYIPIIAGLLFNLLSCNQAPEFVQASLLPDSLQTHKMDRPGTADIVFRSTNGGQTWEDISKGLPENLSEDSIRGNSFFADNKGLFLRVGNELYLSTPDATAPFWAREIFPAEHSSFANGKSGIAASKYWGVNLKKTNGTGVWSPIFDHFSEPRIRGVFETAGGAIFIGTDKGLFKTTNSGKTWKHVYAGGWAGNLAESDGVLVSTSKRRIIRSTDNGENWALVTDEDGITWDVKQVKGGFAAITSVSASDTRRLRTSYDGGKTWQYIDAGHQDKAFADLIWQTWNDRPRPQMFMTSIIQVGENFFCAHPEGIFRSSDKGTTWKLLLPALKGKVFNLSFSGNVIYAIPGNTGC
ncbi:exo-alpha-sialidase [Ferruginibacter sp. HRS2-29]|nr:exo-alpha-sialidase [Ferruginibacter sp. HRS2-29]